MVGWHCDQTSQDGTNLVHIFPSCIFEKDTHSDSIVRSCIEEMEPHLCRRRPSQPHTVICPNGNNGEEGGESLQASVVGAPSCKNSRLSIIIMHQYATKKVCVANYITDCNPSVN